MVRNMSYRNIPTQTEKMNFERMLLLSLLEGTSGYYRAYEGRARKGYFPRTLTKSVFTLMKGILRYRGYCRAKMNRVLLYPNGPLFCSYKKRPDGILV